MGDPRFDLANLAANNELDDDAAATPSSRPTTACPPTGADSPS